MLWFEALHAVMSCVAVSKGVSGMGEWCNAGMLHMLRMCDAAGLPAWAQGQPELNRCCVVLLRRPVLFAGVSSGGGAAVEDSVTVRGSVYIGVH